MRRATSFHLPSSILHCLFPLLLALLPSLTLAADRRDPATPLPPDLDARVNNALAYLARTQRADGAIEGERHSVATTALSLLAFLSAGHTPDVGRHGLVVRGALDYLLRTQPAGGSFARLDDGRAYTHAVATAALAAASGAGGDPKLRKRLHDALARATAALLDAQQPADAPHAGGWAIDPASKDADLALTAWCVSALASARDAGIAVPAEPFKRAAAYVHACHRPASKAFAPQPGHDASVPSTAAALLALHLLGERDAPEAAAAIAYVISHPVTDQTRHYYSTLHAATRAAWAAGEPTWGAVWKNAFEQLRGKQASDGFFHPVGAGEEPGRVLDRRAYAAYQTAHAVLALTTPYRLLPPDPR